MQGLENNPTIQGALPTLPIEPASTAIAVFPKPTASKELTLLTKKIGHTNTEFSKKVKQYPH